MKKRLQKRLTKIHLRDLLKKKPMEKEMSKKVKQPEPVLTKATEKNIFQKPMIHWIMIGILFVIISLMYFQISYGGMAPKASDIMQWRASAQQIMEYNKTHWHKALWTDNMFAGMPSYLISLPNQFPFIGDLYNLFKWLIDWRIFFLIFAGIGMYVLLVHLKFDPLIALTGAFAFALSCHFIGLLEIGHNTKFKAIIYIPWVFWSIDYLRQKRSILSLGFVCMFLIQQFRENHPQISYYMFLMLGIYWLVYLYSAIRDKELRSYMQFSFMFLFSIIISVLAIANPYLSTAEYSQFTIRGGSAGLSREYATGWSFGVGEVMTFLVPKFYGGISPMYWGPMSFTQTSMYMGIIIFFLALTAVIFVRNKLVTVLSITSLMTIFLSFGKNFGLIYDLFFKFVPGFNKFRVPAMILVLLEFSIVVLAAYGLNWLISQLNQKDGKALKYIRISTYTAGAVLFLFLVGKGMFSGLPFVKPEELQQYDGSQLANIKSLRLDALVKSGLQSFIILLSALGLLWTFLIKKISKTLLLICIVGLTVLDLGLVNKEFLNEDILVEENTMFTDFEENSVDSFLLQDKDTFRIFPLGRDFGNARWSYYHQSIGGYHGAKIKRYQDLIESCLYSELIKGIPLNWNVINMLNVKYIIFNSQIPLPNLKEVFNDPVTGYYVYENLERLPRAWFVKEVIKESDPQKIRLLLNNPDFNPARTAVIEENIPSYNAPDTSYTRILKRDIHATEWEVYTDKDAFMTISEVYYPKGWKAFIDGKESPLYQTDYVLRGMVVPAGKHQVKMVFDPASYRSSIILSGFGLGLTILLLIVGIVLYYRKNYRGQIVYVVK